MSRTVPSFAQHLVDAMLDPAALLDLDLKLVHANRAFWKLIDKRPGQVEPGRVAACHDLLHLAICDDECIAARSAASKRPLRFDEVEARGYKQRFSVSVMPIGEDPSVPTALIETFRDTTDEGRMQDNYRQMLQRERERGDELERQVVARTAEVAKKNADLEAKASELQAKNAELTRANDVISLAHKALLDANRNADSIFAALTKKLPGTILNQRFKLDHAIGEGGFGAVFSATDLKTQQRCAVKIFRPKPGNDSVSALQRFLLEASASGRVQHSNVVHTEDSGISNDGIAYLAMEFLEGHTLAVEMRQKKCIEPMRALRIVKAICEALRAAEKQGILHRDVKPENIFIHQANTSDETIKVIDFGNAKSDDIGITQTANIIGTPAYLAPERLQGHAYDARADVYSTGIMLYEMLAGEMPFAHNDEVWALIHDRLSSTPSSLKGRQGIPLALASLVDQTLSRDPKERPTLAQLTKRLEGVERELVA